MAVDTKQAYRRLLEEAFGKGNLTAFDEVCDPGYRVHDPVGGDGDVRQDKENCGMYRSAFPDLRPTLLGQFAEGDTVVTHWRMTGTHTGELMGIAPTGARCVVDGISIGRFKGGKLAESWTQWDALGMLRQLGAAPSAGIGQARRTPDQPQRHA
jgi:predicted ester cyclase